MKNSIQDFWNRVEKNNHPTGCWIWTAGKDSKGYGSFWFNGKINKSHRFSAELSGMNIKDHYVCHHCDNPSCVNPSHLFIGNHTMNMRDMFSKGRRPDVRKQGSQHGMAKLNENIVLTIRANCPDNQNDFKQWALRLQVHPDTIKNIVRRKNWKHI